MSTRVLLKETRLCRNFFCRVYSNGDTETVFYPVKPAHTCVDDNHAPCLVPQCRPLEWYETDYGKYYMDQQRHEGKV